jgi:hypothetical protein
MDRPFIHRQQVDSNHDDDKEKRWTQLEGKSTTSRSTNHNAYDPDIPQHTTSLEKPKGLNCFKVY